MNPVPALRTDLDAAGAAPAEAGEICRLYRSAIDERSEDCWRRFYERLYRALTSLSAGTHAADRRAITSLLLIVGDDFGHALFGSVAIARLRYSLLTAVPAALAQ